MDNENLLKTIDKLEQEKYFYFLYFLLMEELYEKYRQKLTGKLVDKLIAIDHNNKEEN